MTQRHHIVDRYELTVGAGGDACQLHLWDGEGTEIGCLVFVDDGRIATSPRFRVRLSHGPGFFSRAQMPVILEMLRQTGNVTLTLDNSPPGFLTLHCGRSAGRIQQRHPSLVP